MKLADLDATHPTYDRDQCERYDALYRGGKAFRAIIDRFLPKNPSEPDHVYAIRKAEASFRSYVGPIADFFSAQLFSAPLKIRARRPGSTAEVTVDPYYASLKEDADGAGTDLVDLVRVRFNEALVQGASWIAAEAPDAGDKPPANRAEWEERGLGDVRLRSVENLHVTNWEVDRFGELLWALEHVVEQPQEDPRKRRGITRETWRLFDRETVETFILEYDPAKGRPDPEQTFLTGDGGRKHGFSRVPLVPLRFVAAKAVKVRGRIVTSTAIEGLWLLNRVADAQVQHFRLSAALDWNIKRTCYAMPVFMIEDEQRPPTMGAGYFIKIGTNEKVEWTAPPTAHLATMSAEIAAQKDEIYRIANQMANGVENNAAAVGRSGESKRLDAENSMVCLRVYGALVREAIERIYQLVSDARGEGGSVEWSVEGLDMFLVHDGERAVKAASEAVLLDIPSVTFKRELFCRTADALLPGIDQPTREQIRAEIEAGVDMTAAHGEDDDDGESDAEDDEQPKAGGTAPAGAAEETPGAERAAAA